MGYPVNLAKGDEKIQRVVPACETCQAIHKKTIITAILSFFIVAVGGTVASIIFLFTSNLELTGSGLVIGSGIAISWSMLALLISFIAVKIKSQGTNSFAIP